MLKLRDQSTIASPCTVTGFGYWSGRDINVTFRPAPPDTGIVFARVDLPNRPQVAATLEHRVETPRRTVLSRRGARVEMVEHILAALAGLRIDNCFVEVDAAEMPGCDGSSQAFVDALEKAGVEMQQSPRAVLVVTEIMRLGNEETWIEARPAIRNEMRVKYRIDYGSQTSIGRQMYQGTVTSESFRRDLAPCRTFLLQEEAQWLREQGLGNRATTTDLLIFDHDGPIDNELKFENECARHKALDLVGDLALLGCDLVGQFACHCGGHRLHAELARALAREGRMIRERRLTA